MVKVNGTQFPIYLMDDINTVKERIAAGFSSLPKYLHFETELKLSPDDYEVRVIDILSIIKNYSNNTEFSPLYTRILPLMNSKLKMKEDILEVWLAYNTELPKLLDSVKLEVMFLISDQEATEILGESFSVKSFLRANKDEVKKNLEKEIRTLVSGVKEEITLFESFKQVKDGVYHTEFEVEKASFDLTLNIQDISLMEIFNRLQLNNTVPFASYNQYYKIIKEFTPFPNWDESSDSMIMLRVLQRLVPKEMNDDYYAYAFIKKEEKDEKTILNINVKPSRLNINKKDYVKRIFAVLGDIPILDETEDDVKGIFYIPGQSLNKHVFGDLIMNNPIFSNFLAIDEHEKLTKKRSEIIIKFKHKEHGLVTANIIEKFREKSDEIVDKPHDIFPMGRRYLRIHVSTSKNIEVVLDFQNIISKLFVLYNSEYTNIVQEYRKYIPDFALEKPSKLKQADRTIRFKDVSPPELFKAEIGGQKVVKFDCNNKPRVVSKNEAEEIERSGKGQYMLFPKNNEYMTPQYLVCTEHPNHPYPGLKNNPFPSKDKLPYLPCCFIDNQKQDGKKYTKYFRDEEVLEKDSGGQNLITTRKFVNIKQPGTLPDNITRFFQVIDPLGVYYRTGMSRSKSSFLECVLDALSIGEFENDPNNPDERREIVKRERENLIRLAGTGICRQEIYDSTTEEIQKYVADPEFYLDPKLFIALLQEKYKCNIFLFTRDVEGGEMSLPRFSQSYLKFKNNNPCIFVFEHTGAISNMADYPQCELIIKKVSEKESLYVYNANESVSIKMNKMFNKIKKAYQPNRIIQETEFPLSGVTITSQVIDPSGKCRMLYCKYKGKEVSLILSPTPPMSVKEVRKNDLQKLDYTVAQDMIKNMSMTLLQQTVVQGIAKELICQVGNVLVTIPINDMSEISGLSKTNKMVLNQSSVSALNVFNHNKKMARYMVEYVFWLFSNYLHDNDIGNIDDTVLNNFAEQKLSIQPEFEYGDVPKMFSTDSGLMNDGRLVVKTDEGLKRLLYVLRLGLVREKKKILNYYTHNMIENYYMDITDFDYYQYQVILFGGDSIRKWIEEKMTEQHILHDNVVPNIRIPYFFKNPLISDRNVYLAQNTSSMPEVFDIVQNWHENKYNVGYTTSPGQPLKCVLYSYINPKNITAYNINGRENNYNIKVLGYKYTNDGEVMTGFTALLPMH